MSAFIDNFGRTIISDGQGNYTVGGMTVTASSDAQALNSFNGMAPEGWVSAAPAQPTLSDLQTQLAEIQAQMEALTNG